MNAWVEAQLASLELLLQLHSLAAAGARDLNVGGFVQSYANLTIWNINKAGHMVPLTTPYAELMSHHCGRP